jgi:hypothetical protein
VNNIEDDISAYFISNSFATTVGTDLLINNLPETTEPDNVVALFSYATAKQTQALNDFEYNFQCRVRDIDYISCRDRIVAIHSAMYRNGTYSATGRRIVFKAPQAPNFLLFDDSSRTHFVFNFSAIVEGY